MRFLEFLRICLLFPLLVLLVVVFILLSLPTLLLAQNQDLITPRASFEFWGPGTAQGDAKLLNRWESHRQCEQNFWAAERNVEVEVAERGSIYTQLVQKIAEIASLTLELAVCRQGTGTGCGNFKDGSGGALWKPDSERFRRPVVLFPSNHIGGISNPRVVDGSGEVVAALVFRGLTNPDRPTYDVSRSVAELRQVSPVRVLYDLDGVAQCREVPDPGQRYD